MIQQITVGELAEMMSRGEPLVLVDVRQPWEQQLASLPNSQLIPLNELPARAGEVRAPENALVVVYCHHGIRSLPGAALLQRAGFPRVASLAGGIDAWSVQVDPQVPRY